MFKPVCENSGGAGGGFGVSLRVLASQHSVLYPGRCARLNHRAAIEWRQSLHADTSTTTGAFLKVNHYPLAVAVTRTQAHTRKQRVRSKLLQHAHSPPVTFPIKSSHHTAHHGSPLAASFYSDYCTFLKKNLFNLIFFNLLCFTS